MVDKVNIIFVDDEAHILSGLRRAMSGMAGEWEMTFSASGQEALTLMEGRPFDVIVADMRMPQMDGAELLDEVRRLHPSIVRVILSGYADTESVLRTVGPAHLYLAKPCDPRALQTAIRRPLVLRQRLTNPDLRTAVAGLTHLPSLPDLYVKVRAALESPETSAKTVAEVISKDIAMTAELLKLTNSAYFSVTNRVTTPLQAVRTLGLETVQALVLRIGLFRQFAGSGLVAPLLGALSSHSMTIARLAEAIIMMEGGDVALGKAAYNAGMLSFIGSLVLLDGRGNEYRRLLDRVGPDLPLHKAEHEAYGATHAMMGAYLLALWGFNDMVVEAVAYCCAPHECPGGDNLLLVATHAARALGPPLPLLRAGVHDIGGLDTDYLRQGGKEHRVSRWMELALNLAKES